MLDQCLFMNRSSREYSLLVVGAAYSHLLLFEILVVLVRIHQRVKISTSSIWIQGGVVPQADVLCSLSNQSSQPLDRVKRTFAVVESWLNRKSDL